MNAEKLAHELAAFLGRNTNEDADSTYLSATSAYRAGEYEIAVAHLATFAASRQTRLSHHLADDLARFADDPATDEDDAYDVRAALRTLRERHGAA